MGTLSRIQGPASPSVVWILNRRLGSTWRAGYLGVRWGLQGPQSYKPASCQAVIPWGLAETLNVTQELANQMQM